jgi:hypothetical protein
MKELKTYLRMNLSNLIIDADDDGDQAPPVLSLASRTPEERGG